jgi:hypothetical protein
MTTATIPFLYHLSTSFTSVASLERYNCAVLLHAVFLASGRHQEEGE